LEKKRGGGHRGLKKEGPTERMACRGWRQKEGESETLRRKREKAWRVSSGSKILREREENKKKGKDQIEAKKNHHNEAEKRGNERPNTLLGENKTRGLNKTSERKKKRKERPTLT